MKLSKLYKQFHKENVNIKVKITSFRIKNSFLYKDHILNNLKLSCYIRLLVLAVLATLMKHVMILKPGLRNISKWITNLTHLKIWHGLTCITVFLLKQLIKLTLNST